MVSAFYFNKKCYAFHYFAAIDDDDDETVAMIKELLETRIR